MVKATAPIDLLREFRAGFEAEAKHFREQASRTPDRNEELAMGSKAYAAEQAVKKIDATLRDWA